MAERKYVLTKLKAGDYLLPSNDQKWVWRIATYTDGPSTGLDAWPRDKEVWGLWKWHRPVEVGVVVNAGTWTGWDLVSGPHFTRKEAIDEAMKEASHD